MEVRDFVCFKSKFLKGTIYQGYCQLSLGFQGHTARF